ncbi:MAG TPA: polyketide synthase dehydratase domain-containing protein, partial [Candidatus Angelobacter sp.]
ASPAGQPWFARYFPGELLLGDAASRDAALHSVQACIPHKTVLPTGVDSIATGADWTYGPATVVAWERERNGDDFVYDLRIEDAHGRLCERWEGLRLHAVAPIDAPSPWPAALLVPYFERRLAELFPVAHMQISFTRDGDEGGNGLLHRPDGKPEAAVNPRVHVSRSHAGTIILEVRSQEPVGCDVEPFAGRNQADWQGLLGPQSFSLAQTIAKESKIPLDWAATQVWALKEALRKNGTGLDEHLHLEKQFADGWAVLSRGCVRAALLHTFIHDSEAGFAFAFVSRRPQ